MPAAAAVRRIVPWTCPRLGVRLHFALEPSPAPLAWPRPVTCPFCHEDHGNLAPAATGADLRRWAAELRFGPGPDGEAR